MVLEEMQWKVCLGLCEMTKMVERWAKINPATLQQGPTVTGSWERREYLKDEGVHAQTNTQGTQSKKGMEINIAEGRRWKERGLSWDCMEG